MTSSAPNQATRPEVPKLLSSIRMIGNFRDVDYRLLTRLRSRYSDSPGTSSFLIVLRKSEWPATMLVRQTSIQPPVFHPHFSRRRGGYEPSTYNENERRRTLYPRRERPGFSALTRRTYLFNKKTCVTIYSNLLCVPAHRRIIRTIKTLPFVLLFILGD